MTLQNELYFMVPTDNPVGFDIPITASAKIIGLSTIRMVVNVREDMVADRFVISVSLEQDGKAYACQHMVAKEYIHHLDKPKEPEYSKMVPSKKCLYGVAPFIAQELYAETKISASFLTTCIRKFASSNNNLIVNTFTNSVSSSAADELQKEASRLPGVLESVDCPATGEEFFPLGSTTKKVCDRLNDPMMNIIIHLNDRHKWTREQIADWLDKLYAEGVDLAFKDEEIS